MRIHYIQHETFETPAFVTTWAKAKGFPMTSTLVYEEHWQFPALDTFDFLVVMGGSMSTYEEEKYSFLAEEKAFIKACIAQKKLVLGICLGSQLIASACGARVYPNHTKEIGWWPIQVVENQHSLTKSWPTEATVFHWHGDTFDLPAGAVHLAKSEACKNQAFLLGDRVLGLQFHLEIEEHSVKEMVVHGTDELALTTPFVQSGSKILNGMEWVSSNNAIMATILEYFVQIQRSAI